MLKRMLRVISKISLISNGGALLFLAMTVGNVGNFVFHLIVSRQLVPEEYGALGALLGLLLVFAVPSVALQVAITRQVSQRRAREDGEAVPIVAGPLLAQAVIVGLAAAAAFGAASPLVAAFLHLPDVTSAILLALYIVPTALELVPKAVLLGELRFTRVAAATLAGSSVRLVAAYFFAGRQGVDGAMAATVLASVVTVAIELPGLRAFVKHVPGVEALKIHWQDATGALTAFFGFWVLTSAPAVLARHFLDREDSGYYAAANTAAQTAMFLPAAIALIAFPHFARQTTSDNYQARRTLMQSLSFVGVLSIGAACVLSIVPGFIIETLFGRSYEGSVQIVGLQSFASAAMGLVSILVYYHLGAGARSAASLSWLGVITCVVGVALFHSSAESVAGVFFVSAILVLVFMAQVAFARKPRSSTEGVVSRELWELSEPEIDLTMVVPYYNPGPELRQHVEHLGEALARTNLTYEIITVSDGSTDDSALTLEGLDETKFRRVVLERNQGKGQALRVGLGMGRGRYLGFIDADGDIEPAHLGPYLELMRLYEPDVVVGSKRHPMSQVDYPSIRRVYSWGYQQLIYVLFHLKVRDTQTGLKIFSREAVSQILPRMVEKRFAFDLEMFVVARHLGFKKFFEAPIRIDYQFRSTVRWGSVRGTMLDTLAIFYRLHFLHFYDQVQDEVLTETEAVKAAGAVPRKQTPSTTN